MRAVITDRVSVAGLSLVIACAAHEDAPEPAPPAEAPAIIHEAIPTAAPPKIVAPPLPELAPTRSLDKLTLLWRRTEAEPGPTPTTIWPVGETPVAMTEADARSLGLAGSPGDLGAVGADTAWPVAAAGPLLVFDSEPEFVALELGTSDVRWTTQQIQDARSYARFVSPRVLVAHYYTPNADRLIAWALENGRQVWTRDGESDREFSRIKRLWTDGERGYFLGENNLTVFDPTTGATIWSTPRANADCGAASGEGLVVVEDPAGHRVFRADDGEEQPRFAALAGASCGWESYSWTGVAPGVIDGGRLYAFDSGLGDPPHALRAFDLTTRAELWKTSGFDDDLLVVDHDAVFVADHERTLVGLDASTGKERTRVSIGLPFEVSVEPVGGEAGPLVVVEDENSGVWIFGRGETVAKPEAYELRGQLVATEGMPKRRLKGVSLIVGGEVVKTDSRGRFAAKGEARGAIVVEQESEYGEYDPNEWTQVVVEPRRVMLDGSGSYDLGEVPAYEVSIE